MKEEFSLDQLLADPLIRMVMSSDAVEEADIRRLAGRLALRKASEPQRAESLHAEASLRPSRPAYRMPPHSSAAGCAADPCFG